MLYCGKLADSCQSNERSEEATCRERRTLLHHQRRPGRLEHRNDIPMSWKISHLAPGIAKSASACPRTSDPDIPDVSVSNWPPDTNTCRCRTEEDKWHYQHGGVEDIWIVVALNTNGKHSEPCITPTTHVSYLRIKPTLRVPSFFLDSGCRPLNGEVTLTTAYLDFLIQRIARIQPLLPTSAQRKLPFFGKAEPAINCDPAHIQPSHQTGYRDHPPHHDLWRVSRAKSLKVWLTLEYWEAVNI